MKQDAPARVNNARKLSALLRVSAALFTLASASCIHCHSICCENMTIELCICRLIIREVQHAQYRPHMYCAQLLYVRQEGQTSSSDMKGVEAKIFTTWHSRAHKSSKRPTIRCPGLRIRKRCFLNIHRFPKTSDKQLIADACAIPDGPFAQRSSYIQRE